MEDWLGASGFAIFPFFVKVPENWMEGLGALAPEAGLEFDV